MPLLILCFILVIKILLCKGLALAILLLAFWCKGKQLRSHGGSWDTFFLALSAEQAQAYAVRIYLAAAVLSSALSYPLLLLAGIPHPLGIALLFLLGGIAVTAYRWQTKGKAYLLRRYQEIPQSILEHRSPLTEKNKSL